MRALITIACALTVAATANADTIERRGVEPPLTGQIAHIDDAGVTINRGGDEELIRWDHIRNLVTDRRDWEKYKEDAANLWRARTRLERNDAALAEPLFERLFEKYRGRSNETALLVAEGLLRCRLARGAHDAAVIPALETIRLRQSVKTASNVFNVLRPVIDDRTRVCTALAPAFITTSTLVKLERDLATYESHGDSVVAAQAQLYRRAVRLQLGMSADNEKPPSADQPGVVLLQLMLDLISADADRRDGARIKAMHDVGAAPTWVQAWTYYFVGLSLLNEPGIGRQQSGQVSLVHLPATFASQQPYLAGLALSRLAAACEAQGDASAAATLRSELARRFPGHPVLAANSDARRKQPGAAGPATTTRSSKEST